MDEKVKALMERVRETATFVGDAANATAISAGRYAGQMLDVTKLNVTIFDLKSERNDQLRRLGQSIYDTHLGKETDPAVMQKLLEQVDETNRQLDEVKERVALLRQTKTCSKCGALCGREDKYCKECGTEQ